MNEITSQIVTQAMALVVPMLITAIGVIATWLLNELRKWTKSKTDNQTIDTAFNQFDKITKGAVVRAEQAIKEFASDGKITSEEAIKIKKLVFNNIKTQIPKSTGIILKKSVNNFDDFIDSKIEETVYYIKQNKKE